MGFNDQIEFAAQGYTTAPRKKYVYKQNVNIKRMSGKQAITFRLLPAFDPANPDPETSFIPSISPEGFLNDWGATIRVAKFVGHDPDIRRSHEILSLKTLERSGEPVFCPYAELLAYVKCNQDDWGYLTTPVGTWGKSGYQRECLSDIRPYLVCNIFDINDPSRGSQVAEFTISAAKTIYDKKHGIMFIPNGMPGIEQMIKSNYMLQYANGDITNPQSGPVLLFERDTSSSIAGYRVSIAVDAITRSVCRTSIDPMVMKSRVHPQNFNEYLNIMEPQEMVDYLATILDGRSPKGYHELSLLKMALPDFKVPEPPMAPGAMHTIRSGFEATPVAPAAPVAPVASAAPVVPPTPTVAPVVLPGPTVGPAVSTSNAYPVPGVPIATPPVAPTVAPPTPTVAPPAPNKSVQAIPGEDDDFDAGWSILKNKLERN